MIGPRIEENGNTEIMFGSSNLKDLSEPPAKRKLYSGQVTLDNEEIENTSLKKRHMDENLPLFRMENSERYEVVVVNGKWDTSQTIPSIIAEMHSVNLQDLEVVNELCIPWSENSETEISIDENIINIFKPNGVSLESDVDSGSTSGDSIPTTGHAEGHVRSSNETENNCDVNLSWLINFKVESLFNADEIDHDHNYPGKENEDVACQAMRRNLSLETGDMASGGKLVKNMSKCDRMFLSDSNVNVRKLQTTPQQTKSNIVCRYAGLKKPPFTYTELIEQALQERGELTVSGIYNWISEHFPFYKSNDDRWKNSVRHNLSINPHFRKGCKASQGAGHLWAIANKDEPSHTALAKKQRMQQFISNIVTAEEVEAATASIEDNKENRNFHKQVLHSVIVENCSENANYTPPGPSPPEGVSLEQSAEEILSGVKKDVQVQYLIPVQQKSLTKETDFLNPVSKEVVVEESGLLQKPGDIGASYLITDLNSSAMGLSIGESEVITPDTLFAEDIGFHYYELTSPSPQLQV